MSEAPVTTTRYPRKVEWLTPDPARPGCSLSNVVTIPYGWKAPARFTGKLVQAARDFETITKTQKRPVVFPERDQGCWEFGLFDSADELVGTGSLDADETLASFAVLAAMFLVKGLHLRLAVAVDSTAEEKAALDAAGRDKA